MLNFSSTTLKHLYVHFVFLQIAPVQLGIFVVCYLGTIYFIAIGSHEAYIFKSGQNYTV